MTLNLRLIAPNKFVIIALGIVSMLSMGTIYSWSVFRTPLEDVMGISPTQSGLPFLIFLALYAFSMPIAGKLIEIFKPSAVAITGSLIISIAYLLSGFCTTITQIIFTYGVLGGIGVGTLYGVPIAMASRWFPQTKGIAIGATLIGFGLSPLVTAPVASVLIETYGVHNTFKLLGAAFLILLPVISMFFSNPDNYIKDKFKMVVVGDDKPITRHRNFYMLWSLFFITTFSGLMTISISSPFSIQILNLSNTQAAIILSVLAIFNGFGRLIFGFMNDKIGLKATMIFSFLLLLISSLLIATVSPGKPIQFIVSMSILWGVFGGWLTIAPLSVIRFFGEVNSAKNYGKIFTAYGFGAIAGVTLASRVKEITGNYQPVFYIVFIMSIIGLFIIQRMFNQK